METYGIEKFGIIGPKAVYRNLTPAQLTEAALRLGEGSLSNTGALVVTTGKYTGRSPKDKFIVDTESIHNEIAWGKVNRPISREKFWRWCWPPSCCGAANRRARAASSGSV